MNELRFWLLWVSSGADGKKDCSSELLNTKIRWMLWLRTNFIPSNVLYIFIVPLAFCSVQESDINNWKEICFTQLHSDHHYVTYLLSKQKLISKGFCNYSETYTCTLMACCNEIHWYTRIYTTQTHATNISWSKS